nr:immunoglobulin heavy chain junction region [Macaca mulatta]MOY21083.1 immunoglobulin heavy chain junction region [Macaca mulatta]MOY21719.1 immunoglobulin heavy chain junction region [Macaca mulatta]MOY22038.1 immunoglobulin heavy chain junction region [Macaca mulatta]MOY22068.1 immunoglobulin heavy chain junction region [Macaca mulatta]
CVRDNGRRSWGTNRFGVW